MKFKLSDYIVPSIISMVVVGTNANIDGFFIGAYLGDDGLAAINIVWPIVALIASIGTGIGVGGAVLLNSLRGKNESGRAELVKSTTLSLMGLIGAAVTILLAIGTLPLLKMMGATGNVLELSHQYGIVVGLGALTQIFGAGVVVLLRNDGKATKGMIYSVIGIVLHLALDFVLTKDFGMYGVAAATVFSQLVIALLGAFELRSRISLKLSETGAILKGSIAPFGINFVPSLVLMFTNYFALKCAGVAAVSAYAIMCYVVYTFDYVFQGVCDGIQPIISYCTGSGDAVEEKRAKKCALIILAVLSASFMLITPLLIMLMLKLFSVSAETKEMVRNGLYIYMVSYPFKAAVKYICSYYYASGQAVMSNVLVYIDPLFFTPILLAVLSNFFGIDGIWFSMTLTQILVTAIGLVALKSYRRKGNA